jgi:hypothetical protein
MPAGLALIGVKAASRLGAFAVALALAACQPAPPPAALPPAPSIPAPTATTPAPAPLAALPRTDLPPGPIYRCEVGGVRTVLPLPENIESLCRRHPEMGPCQYERDSCRQRGGRVLTSLGEEVTLRVESEYDKRVTRVRFQGDVAPKR